MSSITNCPACQTQFIVTEDQLQQHNGKVRCGNCLNVFDATQHIVEFDGQAETAFETPNYSISDVELNALSSNEASELGKLEPTLANKEAIEDLPKPEILNNTENEPTPSITDTQPGIFDDLAGKSKLNAQKLTRKLPKGLMLFLILALLLAAIAQTIYFLRNDIAIYYPNFKPTLVESCKQLGCTIDLPKKIELIVIDDSDIQEDADHTGLIRLSCTIINQARFNQAYPNLELTLTDVEDKPKLRRIFKPSEYLATATNIANGLAAGEEVKVKVAIATHGEAVAGYRVLVTY